MTSLFRSFRRLAVIAVCLLAARIAAAPAHAVECSTCRGSSAGSGFLVGGFTDGILGDRTKMTQVACMGLGLGVVILLTATRKR